MSVAEGPPNFLFIQGEGAGWVHTSVQMDPSVPESDNRTVFTPSFERLANGGMTFSNFYAPSPRCTPSRATYFTGKSPGKLGMTFVSDRTGPNAKLIPPQTSLEMPLDEITIAELLKGAGYATAHFGKWHVGRAHPSTHGFDASDGPTNNGGPENVQEPNPKQLYETAQSGIAFMTQHARAGRPFFLQVSHYGSRDERGVRQQGSAERPATGLHTDITVGQLLDAVDELGIADNTYVYYTTDHGSPGRANGPLANGKGTVWEGGLRVPLFFRGPGIEPGSLSSVRTRGADLYPTVAQLAGIENLPEGLEGGSLVSVLMNKGRGDVRRSHEEIVFHFPHYDSDQLGPASAILLGDYKLIRFYEQPEAPRLFNLAKDMGERNNLASSMPGKAAELDRRLAAYLDSIDAQMPVANPDYDPSKPSGGADRNRNRDRGAGRGGGGGDGGGGGRNRQEGAASDQGNDRRQRQNNRPR
ncbi:MAG: sulfatase-like hydrolase/transferase [Planctomycetota bacterium]